MNPIVGNHTGIARHCRAMPGGHCPAMNPIVGKHTGIAPTPWNGIAALHWIVALISAANP
jgi:hypothetical protein